MNNGESVPETKAYKCGPYLGSVASAVRYGSFEDVEKFAKCLATADKEALIAIWDAHNKPVKLFLGDTELLHKCAAIPIS
jgi:hypothetical protein